MAALAQQLEFIRGDRESPARTGTGNPEADSQASPQDGFPFEGFRDNGGLNGDFKTRVKTPDEKPGKDKSANKPKLDAPRGTASERQIAEIGDNLAEKAGQLSAIMSGLMPVTSVYMADRHERGITALLNIARRNPKFLAGLQKAATGIDILELAQFLGGLAVAFMVDTGRLQGNEMVAQGFGVTEIIEKYFGSEDETVNPAVTIQVPSFVPVA